MAEAAANPRSRVVQQEGLLSKSLTAIAKIIQWLLLSLLFSILIEWAGMVLWWPDEGLEHSRTMLAKEISYLDTDFRRSVVTSDPARFAKRFADNTYHYLFEVTQFVDFIQWVSPPLHPLGLYAADSERARTESYPAQDLPPHCGIRNRDDAGHPGVLSAHGNPHPGDANLPAVQFGCTRRRVGAARPASMGWGP